MDDQRDFVEEAYNQRILETGDGEIEPELECLDRNHRDECSGPVEYRTTPDRRDGRSFPRCQHHFEKRLADAERNLELLSDVPPKWFDPSYAGESWDED